MTRLYLGADVSKGYCDFVILNKQHSTIGDVFPLDDTAAGYKQLEKVLVHISKENDCSGFIAGFESTGCYENKWIEALKVFHESLNIQAVRLNPIVVHTSQKITLKRNTTDKISAISIA